MNQEIDESLYSRQLYVLGKEAMESMKNTSILIAGLNGVGIEIAKCIILSGVKSVVLQDANNIIQKDLASNYYIKESDIGLSRTIVHKYLSQLNPYVKVSYDTEELAEKHFKENQIVVLCGSMIINQIHFNMIARKYGTKFIIANTIGTFGYIFCDFGDNFIVKDNDGEQNKTGHILAINNNAYETNEKHELQTEEHICINNNGCITEEQVTKIINMNTFQTDKSIKHQNKILNNTKFEQIKISIKINFKTLSEQIENPEFTNIITSDFTRQTLLHNFNIGLNIFINNNKRLPISWDDNDADELIKLTGINKDHKDYKEQEQIIKKLSYTCAGRLCPLDSIIGSIAAQEIIKASSGKYYPIKQWLYYDVIDILPSKLDDNLDNSNNLNKISRYDSQIKILGKTVQKKLEETKVFIVGAGAIGCEHLKNYAMMGIKNIVITDMDRIEKSNLNRQFLFRTTDIGKFKSYAARDAIKNMNPDINIIAQINKVAPETQTLYSEKFFKDITVITTALDNVMARNYIDNLCVENNKPMIDSGTLGTKGNVQVVIPHITESYSASTDPQEKTYPVCTLKNFPYLIEHTIQWGRDLFEGLFVKAPQNFMRYKNNSQEVKLLAPSELSEILDNILLIHQNNAIDVKECISFAYKIWHQYFRDPIYHLIQAFPEDSLTSEGLPFWSGTKKFPTYIEFDKNQELHIRFIVATSNLWAKIFDLPKISDKMVKSWLKNKIQIPKITPLKGAIKVTEEKDKKQEQKLEQELEQKLEQEQKLENFIDKLPNIEELTYDVIISEFEKDDDTNYHIEFIMCASNLRAYTYGISMADTLKTKGIAGNIIPAIATTTSLVSGLVSIELLKVIQGFNKIENYNNSFVNMAISFFALSEPIACAYTTIGNYKFSIWDKIILDDQPLEQVIEYVLTKINNNNNNYEISQVSANQYLLLSPFLNAKQKAERLKLKISTLYETISKTKPEQITLSIIIDTEHDTDDPIIVKINV